MANENFLQLPSVFSAQLTDVIASVQSNVTVQQTLQQVFTLMLANVVLHNAGDPNGAVAGVIYQLCYDTTNSKLYICSTSGSTTTAVWTITGSGGAVIAPSQGGTGVASPTAHTLPVAEGASNFNFLGPLTNGQLLVGSTGLDPVPATLLAGSGISIGNAAGAITISASGAGTSWTDVTGATQALAVNSGYIADRGAGNVTFTLPATMAIGDTIYIVGRQNGWSIAQNVGQKIVIGLLASTPGVGGSIASTAAADCVTLVCTAANTEFTVRAVMGNITVV